MATQAERAFFHRVDKLLVTFTERAARIAIAGELNDEQSANVSFLLNLSGELRDLFRQEAIRQGIGGREL